MKNGKKLWKKFWYLGYDTHLIEHARPKLDHGNVIMVRTVSFLLIVLVAIITSFYLMFDNEPVRNIICLMSALLLIIVHINSRKMLKNMGRYSSVYVDRFIDVFAYICFAVAIYLGTFAAGDEMAVAPVWMFFFAILIFNRLPMQNIGTVAIAFAVFTMCSYVTKNPRNFQYDMMHAVTSLIGVLTVSWDKTRMKIENILALEHLEHANLEILETVEEQEREAELLRHKASRDGLTGLLKKDTFESRVKEILVQSDESSLHAMVCLDVDNFKKINDNFGHLFGDRVLKDLAVLVQDEIEGDHLSGRFGGDEFFLFLPHVASKDAVETSLKGLVKVACKVYEKGEVSYTVSISAGVAFYPQSGMHYHTLFMKADEALYECKKTGKNSYCIR